MLVQFHVVVTSPIIIPTAPNGSHKNFSYSIWSFCQKPVCWCNAGHWGPHEICQLCWYEHIHCITPLEEVSKTGTCKNLLSSGCPAKLKDHAKHAMVRDTLKNQRKLFQEIGHQAAENVSESTVRRVLDEQGFHRRIARKVPFLTQVQKCKRLHGHRNLPISTGRNG